MKTILVATDYSQPANNALDYAAYLAHHTGAELIIFNVFKLGIHASNSLASASNVEHLMQKNEAKLGGLARDVAERHKIKVRWEMGRNSTVESLEAFTSENPVDLVVMGIERNLPEYKIFGNTTTSAIKRMEFPLLVVPHDIRYEPIRKIMYACEASYLSEASQLSLLKEFVQQYDAELDIFHVLTERSDGDRDEAMEQKMDKIMGDTPHIYNYIRSPKVADGIVAGLDLYPADLLVMIPHKLRFFEYLFKGSNTSHMTVITDVPLLVIPNKEA